MPLTFTRQRSSRDLMKIKWAYPPSLEVKQGERTTAQRMFALPMDEALAKIREKDGRPLLVMRECDRCKGTDKALFDVKLNNEKTKLLARWFRCVKMRPNVLKETHTYHNLFSGKRPPHLFLCTADGSTVIPFDGSQGQATLWKQMNKILRLSYRKDPEKAVKGIFRLMSKYDHLESMENTVREQIEAEVEKRGRRSSKVKRLKTKLAKLGRDKAKAKAEQRRLSDLGLKKKAE